MTIINSPYLRVTRDFPEDNQAMRMELNKMYVDIANGVNARSVGLFPDTKTAVTGNVWYINGMKHQTLRQVYPFTATGNVAHGINWNSLIAVSPQSYGTFTDGTNWYGAIYASSTAIAAQVSFYVTNTNIVVLAGAGAPSITSGYIVIEWLANT
jgi:hypothetical protein